MGRKAPYGNEQWVTYIPEAFGQRAAFALPVDHPDHDPEPIMGEVQAMSAGMYAERMAAHLDARQRAKAASGQEHAAGIEVERRMFDQCIRNVRNYEVPDFGPITTGADLWEHGEPEVKQDFSNAIAARSELEAGDRDRLQRQRGSSQAATPPQSGTASNAEPTSGVGSATATPTPPTAS